jgi:hypothetical protein
MTTFLVCFATMSFRNRPRLGLSGFFGLGGVVAFAVDGGNFAAHGTEIGGELAAVVNGVAESELEEHNGGHLDHAAEVDDFGELFAGKFADGIEVFGEFFLVPCGDLRGSGGVVGNFDTAGIEGAVDDCFEEKEFGGGDVAEEFVGGFGAGIGLVVESIRGNGLEDFFGGAAFALQGTGKKIVKNGVGLFWGESSHYESPFLPESWLIVPPTPDQAVTGV